MTKLKTFFLSFLIGLHGLMLSATPVNVPNTHENTMIRETNIVKKANAEETENSEFVPIEYIEEVVVTESGLTVGSTTDITIFYYPKNATERITIKTEEDNLILAELNEPTIDNDTRKKVTGKIAAINPAEVILSFHGQNGRTLNYRDSAGNAKVPVKITIKPYETVSDIINNVMSSTPVLITIISIAATIVARVAIKIFRFGVNYKSNFSTVEQQTKFENSIRNELRTSKSEIQDSLLNICLREINREVKPVKKLQELAESMKADRQLLDVKLDSIDQKYNEIKHMTENFNRLEARVNRLEYGDNTQEVRRSGR